MISLAEWVGVAIAEVGVKGVGGETMADSHFVEDAMIDEVKMRPAVVTETHSVWDNHQSLHLGSPSEILVNDNETISTQEDQPHNLTCSMLELFY